MEWGDGTWDGRAMKQLLVSFQGLPVAGGYCRRVLQAGIAGIGATERCYEVDYYLVLAYKGVARARARGGRVEGWEK